MPTMLLCAGLGTRLRPLSSWCAKALVPVGDRPLLAHLLDGVRSVGGPVVVNAHHRADDVRAFVGTHASGVRVSYEPELLDTAGGVAHAEELLGRGDVVVWNGDILAPVDPGALLREHARGTSLATLAVCPGPPRSGNVGVDAEGRIVRLRNETVAPGEARGGEFVPVHVLGSALRATLPARGCLVGDVYLPALRRGGVLRAFPVDTWNEVGTVPSYLATNRAWLAARSVDHWVGPDARVSERVVIASSVVGAGAEVAGEGRLERCVVWPGARAVAPLADAVVTREGTARA